MRAFVLLALSVVLLVSTACGGDDDSAEAPCGARLGEAWSEYNRNYVDDDAPLPDDWVTFLDDAEVLLDQIAADADCSYTHDAESVAESGSPEVQEIFARLTSAMNDWISVQRRQIAGLRECIATTTGHDDVVPCMDNIYADGLGDDIRESVAELNEAKRAVGIE